MKNLLLAVVVDLLLIPDAILAVIFWACDQKVRHDRPWNEK